ncbi:uncharacterized protein LOC129756664 [Uranotaenia lowii]|uniref:uncharacterized protein LOC129756664 n=1 Tax=Uranotaenia lowii TaxID=190385 RepID=UPI00247B2620|nr:uncharacterized protein LOC129756664 [Uranotaenia lowii]
MMDINKSFCIVILISIHQSSAKAFLGNFLLQAATSLSSSMQDDPQSHVSDFRSQPKADSRADKYIGNLTDDSMNSSSTEQTGLLMTMPSGTTERELTSDENSLPSPFGRGTAELRNKSNNVELYSEIIGNIIGSARERITNAFQRFLTPLYRQQQVREHRLKNDSEDNDRKPESVDRNNSLAKLEADHRSLKKSGNYQLPEANEVSQKKDVPVSTNNGSISLEANYRLIDDKKLVNESAPKDDFDIPSSVEANTKSTTAFQLNSNPTSDSYLTSIGIASTTSRPSRAFVVKRIESISQQLNENRIQLRNRTIEAFGAIVPYLRLIVARSGRLRASNFSESDATSGTHIKSSMTQPGEEINFPEPLPLSRLSHNLLSLNSNSRHRARLALQNAFNKYARLVINGKNASTDNGNSIPNSSTRKEGNNNYFTNVDRDDDSSDDAGGDDDTDDYVGIRTINNERDDTGSMDEMARSSGSIGNGEEIIDNNVPSRASYISSAKRMNMAGVETVGILILEVLGSIAGFTWGAFNQLQLLFQ